MKTVVTHIGPDLDAITSVWLVKTFFPDWEEASLAFVPAGTTLNKQKPDDDPNIIHVDTGFGKFDHHQTDEDTCAALLVYEEIKKTHGEDLALERLVRVVNDVDHFKEAMYPNPTADYWNFQLAAVIDGWRLVYSEDQQRIMANGFEALDSLYKVFQNRLWAEKELEANALPFESRWGSGVGVLTPNDDVIHLAQKQGKMVVVRKDPKKGYVRIKAFPKPEIDLESVYTALKAKDPNASWFLHASHHMVLNGSSKNPEMKPTTLTLEEIIEVVSTL
jgi:hypothetical protein